jgi:hypothetical protein
VTGGTPAAARRKRVFINCPFDRPYENLFLALISGIVCLRLEPHCALELSADQQRLHRMQELIASCAASVHDLSRVTLSGGAGQRVPRLNMPFEVGLACQEAFRTGGQHSFFLFEEVPYRLQRSMSDLNGYEPFIHHGDVGQLLRAVRNALGAAPGAREPTMHQMEEVTKNVIRMMRTHRRRRELQTFFDRSGFQAAGRAAAAFARAAGLLR